MGTLVVSCDEDTFSQKGSGVGNTACSSAIARVMQGQSGNRIEAQSSTIFLKLFQLT